MACFALTISVTIFLSVGCEENESMQSGQSNSVEDIDPAANISEKEDSLDDNKMKQGREQPGISVNIETGFYPHFTKEFLEFYGQKSVFVLATADVLTKSFTDVLINAGRVDRDTKSFRLGKINPSRELTSLVSKHVEADSTSDGILYLSRESTGVAPIGTFSSEIDRVFGEGVFKSWVDFVDSGKYAEAANLLND